MERSSFQSILFCSEVFAQNEIDRARINTRDGRPLLRGCDFFGGSAGRSSRRLMQCDSLAIVDSRETIVAAEELFGDLPEQSKPQAEAVPLGSPRLREPQRDQLALRA